MSTSIAIPVWLLALLVLAVILMGIILWSRRRHRSPTLSIDPDLSIPETLPALAGLTHGHVENGNCVEIHQNGHFFDVLLEAISAATKTVHFETFLWQDGQLGRRLAEQLCQSARSGVTVRVLLDANGTSKMGDDVEQQLRDAGCHVWKFHKRRLRNLGRYNERDHRKLVVLDGQKAFVGGHCIVDTWLGDAQDREHFHDISVRIQGPVVHALQSTFAENWVGASGELLFGDDCFPELEPCGSVKAHAARVNPNGSAPAVKILHHSIIALANELLWIQNPYFLPEPEAIDALGDAVKRGVDVRVMVPSKAASDMPIVQIAAQRNFKRLLEIGVRIFEYDKTLNHQKVMTVDGVWSAIGSSNFDDRSFEINDEITVGFYSEDVASQLQTIFLQDSEHCWEVKLDQWKKRGLWRRIQERLLYLVNEQL